MANSVTLNNAAAIGTGGAAVGLGVWAPSRTYTVGTRSVSPSGRPIVCRVAHTSTATFDATYWTYPSADNSSVVDFTILPDGPLTTAEPTNGCIAYWGDSPTNLLQYQILNGRATDIYPTGTPPTGQIYFELILPNTTEKVKYIWCEFESSPQYTASTTSGLTLVLQPRTGQGLGIVNAGVHWQMFTQSVTDISGIWTTGVYNCPVAVTFTGTIAAGSTTPNNLLVVTGVSGTIVTDLPLAAITGGTFTANTSGGFPSTVQRITGQVSGTTGGAGTYTISIPNTGTAATVSGCLAVPTSVISTGSLARPIIGRRNRLDIVVDSNAGAVYGYVNGVLQIQRSSAAFAAYTGAYGICEGPNNLFKVCEFGISAYLPEFYTSGRQRISYAATFGYSPLTTLTTSWQLFVSGTVAYDESGCVEISIDPFITCTSGFIYMELSSAASAPTTSYPARMGNTGTNCRVFFRQYRYGQPGTTENVGIWAKTDGTGIIQDQIGFGGSTGGIAWRPVNTVFVGSNV